MSSRKYFVDIDFCSYWDAELAYVLGYALSDGNISKDGRSLSYISKDKAHLELLSALFSWKDTETRYPVYLHKSGAENNYENANDCYRLKINSHEIVEDFLALGIEPNKSYTGKYPKIPFKYWWHFLRGIFDGDGNIFFSKKHGLRITIAGNKQTILGIYYDLQHDSIESHTKYLNEDRVKLLFIYGKHAEETLTQMYVDSDNLRLERKYNQWLQWNDTLKYSRNCLLCGIPIKAAANRMLCYDCRKVRYRLMNRRNDHHKRKGVWLPLRKLCKPEEEHLNIESLDRYY